MDSESKKLTLLLVALSLTALVAIQTTFQVHASSNWAIQIIDKNAGRGTIAIALDSKNNPHIAYADYENGYYRNPIDLIYASFNVSKWNAQTVTQGRGTIDLALDSHDYPHIIFNDDPSGGKLMYADWNGSNWTIQKVDDNGGDGSIKIDSNNNPHIAYIGLNADLKYAVWTGSSWNTQTVDSSEMFRYGTSLFLDSGGNPHILYDYSNNKVYNNAITIKYAYLSSSGWNIQTVLSNIDQSFGNLVLDSNGYPHFTYAIGHPQFSFSNVTLKYQSWNGSGWYSQTVASNIDWGDGGYLALGPNNYPYIDYLNLSPNSDNGALIYAEWTGKTWEIQTVDNSSGAIGSGPLAVDSNRNPHICYLVQNPQFYSYVAYLNYATTTESKVTIPMETSTPSFFSYRCSNFVLTTAIIVITLVAVLVAVISLLFYRRHQETKVSSLMCHSKKF